MAMLNNQMGIINLMFDWFCPCSVDLTILRDFCRCETWFGWFTSPCLVQNTANNDMGLAETCSNASCKIGWLWVLSTISLLAHWQPPFFHPCFMCMYLLWMINGHHQSLLLSRNFWWMSQMLRVVLICDHSPCWYRILVRFRFYPYVVHVLLIFLHQFSLNLTIKSEMRGSFPHWGLKIDYPKPQWFQITAMRD